MTNETKVPKADSASDLTPTWCGDCQEHAERGGCSFCRPGADDADIEHECQSEERDGCGCLCCLAAWAIAGAMAPNQ
jgi:hypothetical protein